MMINKHTSFFSIVLTIVLVFFIHTSIAELPQFDLTPMTLEQLNAAVTLTEKVKSEYHETKSS